MCIFVLLKICLQGEFLKVELLHQRGLWSSLSSMAGSASGIGEIKMNKQLENGQMCLGRSKMAEEYVKAMLTSSRDQPGITTKGREIILNNQLNINWGEALQPQTDKDNTSGQHDW